MSHFQKSWKTEFSDGILRHAMENTPSIYDYTEVHRYLRDAWKAKKRRNPAFSMTAWSKQMGLENSSPLSLALKGQRGLPKKYLPLITKSLQLDDQQSFYLEALLDLAKAKKPEEKLFYINKLKELSPKGEFKGSTVEEYKYLSDPLHSAILEMIDLRGFEFHPQWFKVKLQMDVSVDEVQEALQRLFQLKLIQQDALTGKIYKTHANLTTENDVADLGSRHYHKRICEIAGEAIFRQEVSEREYGSYSFNMKKQDLPRAKKMIREFFQLFFKEFEAPVGTGDTTSQLNIQLMKMTR